jgi:hypothetical protein
MALLWWVGMILLAVLAWWVWAYHRIDRAADKVLDVLSWEPKFVPQIIDEARVLSADAYVALGLLVDEGWAEQTWVETGHGGIGKRAQYTRKRLGRRRRARRAPEASLEPAHAVR